ncbi:MAG TPA: hypothetical protein VM580_18840, partial [Labilithrix sp.]|nr:hypothetical protein [Labilithrix sp.]
MDILSKQQASKNHDNTRTQKRIRTRQRVGLAIVGLIPVVSLAWIGCSDDEPAGSGRVDPGGTFGAEVTVTVIGPGRVKGSLPGVDCPTRCFAKYIFESARADGATSTIGLKATASRGAKFKGWTFSSEPIGTQGRGPDKCNPVLRAGTDPGVDKSAAEIELPYGETTGTPPAGQEGPCGGYTKV